MKYEFPAEKLFIRPVDMRKRYGEGYDPNLFKRWEENEEIEKLRNGLYRNKRFKFKNDLDRYIAAGAMYEPSYVSMHSALAFYNFIPESVLETTCISTKKTKEFKNVYGRFSYRKISNNLFWGFNIHERNGGYYRVAKPEKCLLDMAYFYPEFDDPYWIEGMRFDGEEILYNVDLSLMAFYCKVMKSKTVYHRIDTLLEVLEL